MNALLCRVGADQSRGGGSWNGLVDARSGKFVYVAIPEIRPVHPGMEKPYSGLGSLVLKFGGMLPQHLHTQHMHLDPDFEHLTYGDQGERAKQLRANLQSGDLLVFYASLADLNIKKLVYAIIGLYVVADLVMATELSPAALHTNAHTRRILQAGATDLIVRGRPGVSGRLECCLPIGDYREKAYRAWPDLLAEWGGLSVKDGYLQRSARLPRFLDAARFQSWFKSKNAVLLQANN
jgi:Nucleotide modification associated domain 3